MLEKNYRKVQGKKGQGKKIENCRKNGAKKHFLGDENYQNAYYFLSKRRKES